MERLKKDLSTLYNLTLKNRLHEGDHKQRLEHFYKDQAENYDAFRERLLHGRKDMLEICTAFLQCSRDKELIWIDMGGGTAENVSMMDMILPIQFFKKIYVVDLCPSLCRIAQAKKERFGWDNVEIICEDATVFVVPTGEKAHLITFSYSLSMIPKYHIAISHAKNLLDPATGVIGVVDFIVSQKYDECFRQMCWLKRFFWRAWFDLDNIDIGPEKRTFLEHIFKRLYEHNGYGDIPYMPFIKAPYYIWVGNQNGPKHLVQAKVKMAPKFFPPTFLYHQSWEDPAVDENVLELKSTDDCLTLTSGGCNTLNLLLNNVNHVTSVDVNPAQSALLELKTIALQELSHEDIWLLFGEGRHKHIEALYNISIAPYLSESARRFWDKRLNYFQKGLYTNGSMGKITLALSKILKLSPYCDQLVKDIFSSQSLTDQKNIWVNSKIFKFVDKHKMCTLLSVVEKIIEYIVFNPIVCWYAGGVPYNQLRIIWNDGNSVAQYMARCWNSLLMNNHISAENYFYYNIFNARYAHDNCPSYLKKTNIHRFKKEHLLEKLTISTDFFINELKKKKYDKIILMDHVDWLPKDKTQELVDALWDQTNPEGKIIFRSAGLKPVYVDLLEKKGFEVKCVSSFKTHAYMDRVNMYASFYVAVKPL